MNFAVDRCWRDDNPARDVKKLRGGKSYEPWPDSALEHFRKCASPRMVLAMELALHTGQRQGDVLAKQWRHIVGELIEVAQSKTGERLSIPIHFELAEAGCSDREIMAILGHRTAEMLARYTRRAEQSRLAESAVAKLEARAKSV